MKNKSLRRAERTFRRWEPYIGLLLATGFFSWLGKQLKVFGSLGWPEAIFIGLAAACLLIITLAAGLAGWRFFFPIRTGDEASGPAMFDYSPIEARIDALEAELAERLGRYVTHADIHRHDEQISDLRDKLRFVRDLAEGSAEAVGKLRGETEAHHSSVFGSLAAIYHRERMLALAADIDHKSLELGLPLAQGKVMDEEEWESWKAAVNRFESTVGQWATWAAFYCGGDPMPDIQRISVEGLNENWGAKAEQFPDPEGLRVYKTFRIYLRNWATIKDVVHDKVRRKAFEGVDV